MYSHIYIFCVYQELNRKILHLILCKINKIKLSFFSITIAEKCKVNTANSYASKLYIRNYPFIYSFSSTAYESSFPRLF